MSRRRVLFIDDDPRILEGIARLLRPKRAQVEVLTAVGGAEALALLAHETVDVVISDMRMPNMDGAQLLGEVRRLYPQVVRIILSGQSDRETILRAVGPAHQFLSKPCDPEVLTATTLRACALRDLLADDARKRGIASLCGLPCDPQALHALRAALADAATGPARIAELVAGDLGMSAKVMQLTSTSFFGSPRGVLTAREAAMCLGPDILRGLAQGDLAFQPGGGERDLAALSRHASRRAGLARALAGRVAPELANVSEVAGLLAGCVQLLPVVCADTCDCDSTAFLVGLWGLPDAVVEAVQRRCLPAARVGAHDRLSAVIHAASVEIDGVEPDEGFLAAHGLPTAVRREAAGQAGAG